MSKLFDQHFTGPSKDEVKEPTGSLFDQYFTGQDAPPEALLTYDEPMTFTARNYGESQDAEFPPNDMPNAPTDPELDRIKADPYLYGRDPNQMQSMMGETQQFVAAHESRRGKMGPSYINPSIKKAAIGAATTAAQVPAQLLKGVDRAGSVVLDQALGQANWAFRHGYNAVSRGQEEALKFATEALWVLPDSARNAIDDYANDLISIREEHDDDSFFEKAARESRAAYLDTVYKEGGYGSWWLSSIGLDTANTAMRLKIYSGLPGKITPGLAATGKTYWERAFNVVKNSAVRGLVVGGMTYFGGPEEQKEAVKTGAIVAGYNLTPFFSGFLPNKPTVLAAEMVQNTAISWYSVYSKMHDAYGDDWWKQPAAMTSLILDAVTSMWTTPHSQGLRPAIRKAADAYNIKTRDLTKLGVEINNGIKQAQKAEQQSEPLVFKTIEGTWEDGTSIEVIGFLADKGIPWDVVTQMGLPERLALAQDRIELDKYVIGQEWSNADYKIRVQPEPRVSQRIRKQSEPGAERRPTTIREKLLADPEQAKFLAEEKPKEPWYTRVAKVVGRSGVDLFKPIDDFFADTDEAVFRINTNMREMQLAIKDVTGEKKYGAQSQRNAEAIFFRIALQNDVERGWPSPSHQLAMWGDKMDADQLRAFRDSQKLSPELESIADAIITSNAAAAKEAAKAGVLDEYYDRYIAVIWDHKDKPTTPKAPGRWGMLQLSSDRTKLRTRPLLEGFAEGDKLKVKDATHAQQIAQLELYRVMASKKLMATGDAAGFFRTDPPPDWVALNNPLFGKWAVRGQLTNIRGPKNIKNSRVDESGQEKVWMPYYARKDIAATLNNALGRSAIYDMQGGIGTVAKDITLMLDSAKATKLMSGAFHAWAFARSAFIGGRITLADVKNPKAAYNMGQENIRAMTPLTTFLVRQGMTIGRRQDWDPVLWEEHKTFLGAQLDKIGIVGPSKKFLLDLRERHAQFLFGDLGPNLKVRTALIDLGHEVKNNKDALLAGKVTVEQIGKIVAQAANADFGGIHLGRMGRNPTMQHIFKAMLLAPDWTESNMLLAARSFKPGREGKLYRDYWKRVFVKAAIATHGLNMLSAGLDPDVTIGEQYEEAWESGNLNWMKWDQTVFYKFFGSKDNRRRYFSIPGHFLDPLKAVTDPIRFVKNKSSLAAHAAIEAFSGTTWDGQKFTDVGELLGLDQDERRESVAHQFTKRTYGVPPGSVEASQIPSFLGYRAKELLPIQIGNALSFFQGEVDMLDSIARSVGLGASKGPDPERRRSFEDE